MSQNLFDGWELTCSNTSEVTYIRNTVYRTPLSKFTVVDCVVGLASNLRFYVWQKHVVD